VTVRLEAGDPAELSAIRRVNEAAFRRADEANLVEALRTEGAVLASLVAELGGHVVGHILFSRMWIESAAGQIPAAALAPVAVLPENQRQGIGGRLIRSGLDVLRQQGERIVVVLGHPDYYPRFGFSTEMARSLESPFPADAYMALEIEPGTLKGIRGKVRYAAAFSIEGGPP